MFQASAALVVVVALVLLAGRLAKRYRPSGGTRQDPGALRLRATLALDTRRRIHLIETPGGSVLVLTGGGSDQIVTLAANPKLHSDNASS